MIIDLRKFKENPALGDKVVEVESSNVDLVDELTEMIPTKAAFSANAKTLQTSDKMLGSLLDILG